MNIKALPFALLPFLAMFGTPAVAQDAPGYTIEDVTACSPDAMRLCKDKLPDVDAIESCMKAHYEELRPKCKARFSR